MADSLDKLMYSFVVDDVIKNVFIHVPPGYVACVYDMGRGVLKKVLAPGLHIKIPFWQKAKLFNTQTLEYTISKDFLMVNPKALGDVSISCVSSDDVRLQLSATILLRLDVHQIPHIWQTIGEDFVEKIVRPTIQSRVRMVVSRFHAHSLGSTHRAEFEHDLKTELERILYPRGIFVENILLSDVEVGHH